MAKKKMQFYEEMEFDNVQYAVDVVNEYSKKQDKVERGFFLAVVATLINVVSWIAYSKGVFTENLAGFALSIGLIGSVISYIMGGGILTALRWAWRIGAFFWYIFVFPLDIMVTLLAFGFAFYGFLFVPVIFVYMNYRQINMDYKAAKKYLSYFKAKTPQKTQPTTARISSQTGVRANTQAVSRTGAQTGTRTYAQANGRTGTQASNRTYAQSSARAGASASGRTYSQTNSRTGTQSSSRTYR